MANIQIKRKTGASTYENLYPATVISQVDQLQTALDAKVDESREGVANGIATLDAAGKIPASQLSAYIQGGVKLQGTMSTASYDTVGELLGQLETIVSASNGAVTREEMVGYAWIASAGFQLTQGTLPANTAFSINPGDEGDTTVPIDFEVGDILLVSNYSLVSTTHTWTLAVLNNSYGVADSSVAGIVTLTDANDMSDLTNGESKVITENFLFDVKVADGTDLYNTGSPIANKLAPASHTHSQYQDKSTILTSLAAQTIAADALPYGSSSNTFSTTTLTAFGRSLIDDANNTAARTTLGLTIGTDVQGYSAKLAAIAGLAVTDGNFIVGDGSTFVAESGLTARTSLNVYSTSETDTQISNSITNKPNVYYDLAKSTADSSAPIGSYIYDDLSTSNGW